jgi:predicted PurR-regulated permease PerM
MPTTRKQLWIDIGGMIALVLAVGTLCVMLGSVLIPFAVSAFIAYLLMPIVEFLEHRGLSRQAAVGVIYGMGILSLVIGAWLMFPSLTAQIERFHTKLPEYSRLVQERLVMGQHDLEARIPELKEYQLAETITTQATAYLRDSISSLPQLLLNIFTVLSIVVIVPFMTWYFLIEGTVIKKAIISVVPNRYFEAVLNLIYLVDTNLSAYLFGQMVDALLIGLLSAVGYSLIGVHYGMVIGLLSGLANLIPYVGPVVGASAAILITVMEVGITPKVVAIIVVASSVQVVDNFLVQPTLMSRSVDLHPFAVVAILLVAGDVWGLWGMLLGIPVFCACKIFLEEVVGVVRRRSVDAM